MTNKTSISKALRIRQLMALVTACLALIACTASPGTGESISTANSQPRSDESTTTSPDDPVAAIQGGTLRYGISAEVPPLEYSIQNTGSARTLASLIHRGLMMFDPDGELVSALAETYEAPDPTTYIFHLRENLYFSDGSVLTSEDVKASFEYYMDPANGSYVLPAFQDIASIDTPDAQTVVVNMENPNLSLLYYTALPYAAVHPRTAIGSDAPAHVGAGPYVVDSTERGIQMSLIRNEYSYEKDRVVLDGIDLIYYTDGTARSNALIGGNVDLIDYVDWADFERLQEETGLTLEAEPGPFMMINFNVDREPWNNPLVRRAVAHAVNRENVVDGAFLGHARPLYGFPVTTDAAEYHPSWDEMWTYDPDLARELLAEAGFPDGFSTSILTSSQFVFHQDTALSVQADLRAIGIDATLDSGDWPTKVEKGQSGEYEITVNGGSGLELEPGYIIALVQLSGSQHGMSFNYDNPALVEALAAGVHGESIEEKVAQYEIAREMLIEETPLVPLVSRNQAFAWSDSVGGFSNMEGYKSYFSTYTLAYVTLAAGDA